MNLSAYDNLITKVDKSKTWYDVKYNRLMSREFRYHNYYSLMKRYEPNEKTYSYYVALYDNYDPTRICKQTKIDNFGRIKILLGNNTKEELGLLDITEDIQINVIHIDEQEDGDIYKLDI